MLIAGFEEMAHLRSKFTLLSLYILLASAGTHFVTFDSSKKPIHHSNSCAPFSRYDLHKVSHLSSPFITVLTHMSTSVQAVSFKTCTCAHCRTPASSRLPASIRLNIQPTSNSPNSSTKDILGLDHNEAVRSLKSTIIDPASPYRKLASKAFQ